MIFYMLAVSSISTYGILLAGWSANSKYAFLGSLRSTAQLISYELVLSSAILLVIMLTGAIQYIILFLCLKLSNSGNILKLLIPNEDGLKALRGWEYKLLRNTINIVILLFLMYINYSCKVISQTMIERKIDNRGSKSATLLVDSAAVKEQWADGSLQVKYYNAIPSPEGETCIRYALMDLEINFPLEILSKNKNTLIRFSPIKGMNIRTPVVGLVPGFSSSFQKKFSRSILS